MVNEIINAITKQMGVVLGNQYKYYVEDIKQGMVKPSFLIDTIAPRIRSTNKVLYDNIIPIVIYYYHDNELNRNASREVGARVIEALEYLPVGDKLIRGENISEDFSDNVYELFITYRFKSKKELSSDGLMEEIII